MVCCAFAIFLVAQLLAPIRALGRHLGIVATWRPDPAVEWRPGAAPARPRRPVRRLMLSATLLGFVAAGALEAAPLLDGRPSASAQPTGLAAIASAAICGTFGKDAR